MHIHRASDASESDKHCFQVYDQNFEEALQALHIDARGVAAEEGWQVDVATLRHWLRRLRGICTHPQVGQLVRQANKLAKSGGHTNVKTIAEVFEVRVQITLRLEVRMLISSPKLMRDQGWRDLMDDRKLRVSWRFKKWPYVTKYN